ncbi:MAG: hypothetical protein AAB540_01190, partial [Patescibacteria group bacterium]
MGVVVWKGEKESNERLIARFNKKVQGSRRLLELRSKRYHSRKPNKKRVRTAAIMRDFYRAKREKSKFY